MTTRRVILSMIREADRVGRLDQSLRRGPRRWRSYQEMEAATGLGGRALAHILMPGVDAEW